MQVILDGKAPFALRSNPATVGAALIEINDHLQAEGRALQAIVADGRNVPPVEINRAFGSTSITDIESLEITSARVTDLIKESIEELKEVLPELPVACQSLAEVLRGPAPHEGFAGFNQLLEIWETVKDRQRQLAEALGVELGTTDFEGAPLARRDQALTAVFDRAKQAMESSDFATLSDLLAYDLGPSAEQESDIVQLLESRA